MDKKPETPLSQLTDDQKTKLKSVTDTLMIDKITVSYSIEERTLSGRKASAFYSVTASRGTGAEITQLNEEHHRSASYTPEETKIARLLLSKHVVASVYDDAVRRGMMSSATAQEELRSVLGRYDAGIVRLIQNGNGCACKEPK
jgi:hypothetical protein